MNPDVVVPSGGVLLEDATEAMTRTVPARCPKCLAIKRGVIGRVFHWRVCGGAEWAAIRARFDDRRLKPGEVPF